MSGELKYNEAQIREMIQILRNSAAQFNTLAGEMQGTARNVTEGALIGQAGSELSEAIGVTLVGAINRLSERLTERARFVEIELEQLIAAAANVRG